MRFFHVASAACLLVALGLGVSGATGPASVLFWLGTVIEILGFAITGKQTNDGER